MELREPRSVADQAAQDLTDRDEPDTLGLPPVLAESPAPDQLHSLFDCLARVPECRKARGKRYPLQTILVIAVVARLVGYRGVTAFGEFAASLTQEQLAELGSFFSPSKQCYTAPSTTTFRTILADLPPDTVDYAIGLWAAQQTVADALIAVDGKNLHGASMQTANGRRMMVAAVEHKTCMVLGQVEVDAKSNKIPAVRALARRIGVTGRIVTMDLMDAMHAQQDRQAPCRDHLVPHLARPRTRRTREASVARAGPLGH